jgi:hypothetical protein
MDLNAFEYISEYTIQNITESEQVPDVHFRNISDDDRKKQKIPNNKSSSVTLRARFLNAFASNRHYALKTTRIRQEACHPLL